MPELPEVETIVRGLRKKVTGRVFSRSEIRTPACLRGSPEGLCAALPGERIVSCGRRGKNIVLHLSGGSALVVHLRMTGQLRLVSPEALPGKHTRAIFGFRRHSDRLFFNDSRKFGRIWLEEKEAGGAIPSLKKLGPEPLELSTREFIRLVKNKKRQIKPLLLDQGFLAGVGNIYADESLHRARIHPRKNSAQLGEKELGRLFGALREVLREAIRAGGTSVSSYVDSGGKRGGYQDLLRVYRRAGEACLNCGGTLLREMVGGRSTFFCPRCQPAPVQDFPPNNFSLKASK